MPGLIPDRSTCLITHRGCLDGTGCALAFIEAGGLEQNIIFLDPSDLEGLGGLLPADVSRVWFADCCPGDLSDPACGRDFAVFDHHITNIRRHSLDVRCLFNEQMCGTSVFSSSLSADLLPMRLCKAIEDYDLGRFSNEDGLFLADLAPCFSSQLEFIAYLRRVGLKAVFDDPDTVSLVKESRKRSDLEVDASAERSLQVDFMGSLARFTTSLRYNCNKVAEKLLDMYPECQLIVLKDTASTAVSLRSRGFGCDCSLIAQQFGGGGHRRAAGFSIKETK